MAFKNPLEPVRLTDPKDLRTLVEHKTTFTLDACELNIFETYETASLVPLTFNDLVVSSMLKGKKVMHLFDNPGFDYLPGETVIVPPKQTMHIDFPEASIEDPTQCIALAIDGAHIRQTLDSLNEKYPRNGNHHYWDLNLKDFHFNNDEILAGHINKIITICQSTQRDKNLMADMALQDLILRLAQNQHLNEARRDNSLHLHHPLYYVTQYIKAHIAEKFRLEDLYKMACMSKVTFYRSFKREFGISPTEYILQERIRMAKQLLALQETTISNVGLELGFADTNYFHRQFKKVEGITPKQFKLLFMPDADSEN